MLYNFDMYTLSVHFFSSVEKKTNKRKRIERSRKRAREREKRNKPYNFLVLVF